MDIGGIIDIAILALGFYALYAAFVLKKSGKIVKAFLTFRDVDVNKCRDIRKLADIMVPRLGVLGIAMIVYGAVSVYNTSHMNSVAVWFAVAAVFMAALAWYAVAAQRCARELF